MKERNYYKDMNFAQNESSSYEFSDKGKIDIMDLCEQREIFFNSGSC